MFKGYFILFWILLYVFRFFFEKRKDNFHLLVVSFFLTSIPMLINVPVGKPLADFMSGTLGSQIYLFLPFILLIVLLPVFNFRLAKIRFLTDQRWLLFLSGLLLISFINPENVNKLSTFIAAEFIVSNILLFSLLRANILRVNILRGMYDAFFVLGVVNFILAICFPVLGIKSVTTFIHILGEEGATRLGSESRAGAIGVFSHPGNLALFTTISSIFCLYFISVKKRVSKTYLILILNLLTLILTFSRTAYLVYAVSIGLIYYVLKHPRQRLFSIKNTFRYAIPLIVAVIGTLMFSSFNSAIAGSDVSEQFDNRTLHWAMGFLAFNTSPLLGVGINSHLMFFSEHLSLTSVMNLEDFFLANPIHNIHLVVLSETGLLGFVCWCMFLVASMNRAKRNIASGVNVILSSVHIGIILTFILYGLTGWAPFSLSILPFFLFITFFTNSYSEKK